MLYFSLTILVLKKETVTLNFVTKRIYIYISSFLTFMITLGYTLCDVCQAFTVSYFL